MNEQIKELAEQAWDSLIDEMGDVVSEDGSLNSDFLHTYVQRFAELIVRECAEVVQEGRWMVPPSQEQLARSIKQHFGVEK